MNNDEQNRLTEAVLHYNTMENPAICVDVIHCSITNITLQYYVTSLHQIHFLGYIFNQLILLNVTVSLQETQS